MTMETDTYRRPPVMKPLPDIEPVSDADWRGEHFWKVPRNPHNGGGFSMKTTKKDERRAALIERREKLAGLVGKGLTETDIAAILGVSRTAIRTDLKCLGLTV